MPGEETATDPGVEVREQQARSDQSHSRRRALLPLLASLPVVLGVVGLAAFLVLKPAREVAVLDFDEGTYYMPDLDMLVAAAETNPSGTTTVEPTNVVASNDPQHDPRVPKIARFQSSGSEDPNAALDAVNSGRHTEKSVGLRKIEGEGDARLPDQLVSAEVGTSGPVGGSEMSLSFGASDRVLTDADEIREMIMRVLRAEIPKLNQCYERRLRVDPAFGGKWAITLTVTKEGSVDRTQAVGQEARDPEFEQCLLQKLGRWRFMKIAQPQPIKKTIDFHAAPQ